MRSGFLRTMTLIGLALALTSSGAATAALSEPTDPPITEEAVFQELRRRFGMDSPPPREPGEPTLEGPNVVYYPNKYDFADSERFIVDGERTSVGGCTNSLPVTAPPLDGSTVVQIEREYDPDTCRSLFERGTLQEEDFASTESAVSDYASDAGGSRTFSTQSGTSSPTPRHAFHKTIFNEPARRLFGGFDPVNSVHNYIDWSPDGQCAIPAGTSAFHGWKTEWLTLTGWSVISNQFAREGNCTRVNSASTVHFQNFVFCNTYLALIDESIVSRSRRYTNVYYEPNIVEGYLLESGNFIARADTRKDGFCSFLLQKETRDGTRPQ